MRITYTIPALFLAACAPAPAPEADGGFTRITERSSFVEQVVGKRLTVDGDEVVINQDGTFEGDFNDVRIAGTWEWSEDGYWCRTITEGSARPTDCQQMEIQGNQVRGTRDRGTGSSFVYTIEG